MAPAAIHSPFCLRKADAYFRAVPDLLFPSEPHGSNIPDNQVQGRSSLPYAESIDFGQRLEVRILRYALAVHARRGNRTKLNGMVLDAEIAGITTATGTARLPT